MKCDKRFTSNCLSEQRIDVRRWRDIERCMEQARDLRAEVCSALFVAASSSLRWIRALRTRLARGRPCAAMRAALLIASATTALTLTAGTGFAQEARDMAARAYSEGNGTDDALLVGLGLEAAAIENCEDVEMLWRAVRELVLPGRISEAMQQRILRRVWVVDPATRDSSMVDSVTN